MLSRMPLLGRSLLHGLETELRHRSDDAAKCRYAVLMCLASGAQVTTSIVKGEQNRHNPHTPLAAKNSKCRGRQMQKVHFRTFFWLPADWNFFEVSFCIAENMALIGLEVESASQSYTEGSSMMVSFFPLSDSGSGWCDVTYLCLFMRFGGADIMPMARVVACGNGRQDATPLL